jgi:hypothetical protein
MRDRSLHVLAGIFLLVLNCGTAIAQQDGDVTVIIKAKSKPTALPTLLVMCDLVCTWKLDGEVKGKIDAGGSAKVKVEPGQHMVEATTEDGVDLVKQPSTVKPTGQTMVNVELWPIRYARLVVEQEARDNAAQMQAAREQSERDEAAQAQAAKEQSERDARDKVLQEAQAKTERESREKAEQEERDRAAREEAAGVTWTDTATGLMWTKKGKGNLNWKQATAYCQNLQLEGHSDWRLPRIEELQGIYDRDAGFGSHNVKGNLQVPKWWEWSSSRGDSSEKVLIFDFKDGIRFSSGTGRDWPEVLGLEEPTSALCVRRAGQ